MHSISHGNRVLRLALVLSFAAGCALAFPANSAAEDPWKADQVIEPADLAKQLKSAKDKPLIIQVGFSTLFKQSHIRGAKYCGPASKPEGLAQLKKCLTGVSHEKTIVIYCGCCPWKDCPNIRPAFAELSKLGFKNVKVLSLPDTFGKDWQEKGYPTAAGQ
ncbi:MAG TPA: rhodanese-like domain-containing protein [Terriglobia bacterium]|nr:rhodanese-like domain-containing protein [Terriglobia bacterium]